MSTRTTPQGVQRFSRKLGQGQRRLRSLRQGQHSHFKRTQCLLFEANAMLSHSSARPEPVHHPPAHLQAVTRSNWDRGMSDANSMLSHSAKVSANFDSLAELTLRCQLNAGSTGLLLCQARVRVRVRSIWGAVGNRRSGGARGYYRRRLCKGVKLEDGARQGDPQRRPRRRHEDGSAVVLLCCDAGCGVCYECGRCWVLCAVSACWAWASSAAWWPTPGTGLGSRGSDRQWAWCDGVL